MAHVVIVGGGFAGVWSAAAAARVRGTEDLRITLIAPGDDLVLRPRLYEPEPERATVALKRVLEPVGVGHLRAAVQDIDVDGRTVTADGRKVGYDRLVLAAGSRLVRPEIPGAERMFDVDTLAGARRLRGHLRGRDEYTAVVVGAGFAGLEIASELAGRGRVVLVEKAGEIAPELGPGPLPVIEVALERLGVECRLGTTVAEVTQGGAMLADGSTIPADAVVWTAGLEASTLTSQIPGERDPLGRLKVDAHLRAHDAVFAAGDVAAALADEGHLTMQSCQHAIPMGKTAGHNAAADLLGVPPIAFAPAPYVTDLDLGAAGAVYTRGWDRLVALHGAEGKWVKRWLMDKIHPPVDDAATILAHAGMVTTPIPF
ncbi:NAD(P)/FAD-dependent oxidoreductase [Actinomadura citrea]|uniref:NADH dehydrogenase n=1 Tax=Actinomadura citrea TaxID=46158 RepID=A0A7Y9KBD6_9ACTN|nr:FAD-dependent oxidoreductase [Actinomadura citrea]NYE11136.1 NADH dehydrogenase [Actinomadura citrea]GGT78293.1 pyridine nucleotide-disulfide oxidoreductase [Actinomadura citrea]